jgi:hypothetical protein
MSGGRIALLVSGIVVALAALAALAGGIAILVVNHTHRDSDGYFASGANAYETGGYALVSEDLDVGSDGPDWLFEKGRLATLRLRSSSVTGRGIFIGIARTDRVKAYLAGTSYDLVTDVDFDPFQVAYRSSPGASTPAPPTTKTFWLRSKHGPGRQSLEWDVEKGNWSAVVMNADGSPGVDVRLSVGAKVGLILWVGLGIVIVGAILLFGAVAMIYFSLRGRRGVAASPAIPAAS